MDSVEMLLLAGGAAVIALVTVIVLVLPRLGGDPTKSVGGDPSGTSD